MKMADKLYDVRHICGRTFRAKVALKFLYSPAVGYGRWFCGNYSALHMRVTHGSDT